MRRVGDGVPGLVREDVEPDLWVLVHPAGDLYGSRHVVLDRAVGWGRSERHDPDGLYADHEHHDGRGPGPDAVTTSKRWGRNQMSIATAQESNRSGHHGKDKTPPASQAPVPGESITPPPAPGGAAASVAASVAAICLGALLAVWAYTGASTSQD